MTTIPQPKISDGIDANRIEDALRVSYDAFSAKLGGFRSADDMVRLFRDAVDGTSCLSAASADGGGLLGVLTFHTKEKEILPSERGGAVHAVHAGAGAPSPV